MRPRCSSLTPQGLCFSAECSLGSVDCQALPAGGDSPCPLLGEGGGVGGESCQTRPSQAHKLRDKLPLTFRLRRSAPQPNHVCGSQPLFPVTENKNQQKHQKSQIIRGKQRRRRLPTLIGLDARCPYRFVSPLVTLPFNAEEEEEFLALWLQMERSDPPGSAERA